MSIAPSNINANWLDEELRKEKAIVTELRELVDKQSLALADQAQRIATLESRLGKTQAALAQIGEVEQAIQNTRDELVLQMSDLRQDVQKRESEAVRARQTERERDARAINDIAAELERFGPLEQSAVARQAEDQRLNEMVLRVQEEVQSVTKRFPQQDDATRIVQERVERLGVRLGQVEMSAQEHQEAQQTQGTRMLLVEAAIPKLEQKLAELQGVRQAITKHQEEMLENQRLSDRARAQSMTEWGRRIESFAHQLELWSDQMRFYADQHEKNRRVLREVQEITHQIGQQQDQLKQVQRIAEDQIRHELLEFRTEIERRLAQEIERRKVLEQQQVQQGDLQNQRLSDLEQVRKQDLVQVGAISERIDVVKRQIGIDVERIEQIILALVQQYAEAAQLLQVDIRTTIGREG